MCCFNGAGTCDETWLEWTTRSLLCREAWWHEDWSGSMGMGVIAIGRLRRMSLGYSDFMAIMDAAGVR